MLPVRDLSFFRPRFEKRDTATPRLQAGMGSLSLSGVLSLVSLFACAFSLSCLIGGSRLSSWTTSHILTTHDAGRDASEVTLANWAGLGNNAENSYSRFRAKVDRAAIFPASLCA